MAVATILAGIADDSPENTDVYRVETWSRRQNVLVNHATKTIATLDANMVPSHRERFVAGAGRGPALGLVGGSPHWTISATG
jgi:hypothetical protein